MKKISEIPKLRDILQNTWSVQLSSVAQSLFVTPWIAVCQAYLSITNSRSSLKLTSIELVIPSSHLILCRPLLLLPPIPPSIRVFSNKSALHIRWPKYRSFSFSISPSKEHPGLISFRMDWLVDIYPLPFESPSHLPPHPIPLGWYRAPVGVSRAIQKIHISYLFYIW